MCSADRMDLRDIKEEKLVRIQKKKKKLEKREIMSWVKVIRQRGTALEKDNSVKFQLRTSDGTEVLSIQRENI